MTEPLPFFVYGTLLPNQPNFHYWQDAIEQIESAELSNCQLFSMGHFPMLIESGNAPVKGAIVTVNADQYATIIGNLDTLEHYDPENPDTSPYVRALRTVKTAAGEHVESWVYIGQKQYVADLEPLPNGDWAAYSAENHETLNHWWDEIGHNWQLTKDD